MAELVAEAFLTTVFEKLFEQLASSEFRKNSVASKLKELERKLKKARLLVDDAEDRQVSEPSVKEWLDELKHLVFMADDLVEEINNSKKEERSGRKVVTGPIKSLYHSLAKTVQGEIDTISTDLDALFEQALVLQLKHGNSSDLNRRSSPTFIAPLREEHHVFGREAAIEEILKMLLSDDVSGDKNIGVLPIVAMGGLGKTTLAQLVYDDAQVKEHNFVLKAWVTVSTEFDVVRIIKAVLKQVDPEALKVDEEEPNKLQRLMKDALRGKRFLFVLDDVWDKNYNNWDILMSNFATGERRSRIIVTTRNRDVGAIVKTGPMYELQPVSDDGCWGIFVHHAFSGDTNTDLRLQEIGRRIVEKCKGVPLAVKSIGGLLRTERNPKKWESILTSHVWEWSENQESNNGVLPSLWLSYRYLPSSLKQCFAYCSIFPQDYEFQKKKLVLLWMAEGFLPTKEKEKRMEQIGEQYFDDLISRSLLQRSPDQDSSTFVMHDLVHDLAVFVSSDFCFRFGEEGTKPEHLTTRTRHLSHINVSVDYDSSNSLSIAKHLRTFMKGVHVGPHKREYLSNVFVKRLTKEGMCLRALSFSMERSVLHHSLGDLKHLRYLELSRSKIKELPDSICSLFNLQTLLLSECRQLTRLPKNMRKLINLRHLDTTYTCLEKMPPKMGDLKKLQTLTDFFVVKPATGCSTIKELGELPYLAGKLHVRGLQNVETVDDCRKANFREKTNLVTLVLEWTGEPMDTREWEVLDALQPHTNLEELSILRYAASSFPIWVCDTSFSNMVLVSLSGGSNNLCRSLPPLGQLPSLKGLSIDSFNGVESIGSEFCGNSNSSFTPFPCLESLAFRRMGILKELSFVGKDGKDSGCFNRLKRLRFYLCPNLGAGSLVDCETLESLVIGDSYYSLECLSLDKFPSLKSLFLDECPKLKSLTSSTEDHRPIPSLIRMVIQNCPELESFPEGGLPLSLDSLEIRDCSKMMAQNRHWDLQRLTSLTSLTISDCDEANNMDSFPQGLLPTSLTSSEL